MIYNLDKFYEMVDAGYSLTPLREGKKIPLLHGWNRGEVADKAKIREWSMKYPQCNFGVRTDGLFVIDVDDPKCDWFQENNWLLDENPMMVRTRKGWHLYFQINEDTKQSPLAKGVDVRCCGRGFVVSPGSKVDNYEYSAVKVVPKDDLPALPDALLMVTPKDEFVGKSSNGSGIIKPLTKGERNEGLAKIAGRIFGLLYNELDYDVLLIFLHTVNRYKCNPPLDDSEVNTIGRSIYRKEQTQYNAAKGMLRGLHGANSSKRVQGGSSQTK